MYACQKANELGPNVPSATLEHLFAHSRVPLSLTSAVFNDSPLLMVNDAFLELTGYAREDVIGRNCRFLQGPGTELSARRKLKIAIEKQSETLVRIRNYRKDGSPFDNYVFLRPVFFHDGQLIYMIGSQYGFEFANVEDAMRHAELLEDQIDALKEPLAQEGLRISKQVSFSANVLRALVDGS